jgi:putative glycerol-1-phosphate prenyltransferase
VNAPIFVGGGICTPEQAISACEAGADVIVVGNAFEKDPQLVSHLAKVIHGFGFNASQQH